VPNFNFDVILRYQDDIVSGFLLAIEVAAVGLALATVIGLLTAFARTSGKRWLSAPVAAYVEFIRNVPLLLLIFIFYFGVPMFAYNALPRGVADLIVVDAEGSVIIAMAIYGGAYLSEVFRAGILSVGRRYLDAGLSLGLSRVGVARFVTLPIMLRTVLPALSNTFISLFKDTSLAAAISLPELTFAARKISTDTFRVYEAWITVGAIYLATSYVIALSMRALERRIRWTV
jgi:His/Glu/Gln/Arg/opine family amino acid ABC transporter permease subunit